MEIRTGKGYRRRVERMTGLWYGRYKANRYGSWVECRLFDVSVLGAAMEVADAGPCTGRLKLEIQRLGSAGDRVRLRAEVRNRHPLPNGNWRVGVEFVDRSKHRKGRLLRMIKQHRLHAA